jgi:hypothetical protein
VSEVHSVEGEESEREEESKENLAEHEASPIQQAGENSERCTNREENAQCVDDADDVDDAFGNMEL